MKINKMIKTTILTSTAFLLLSSHAFADEAIQPVKIEKVNDKQRFIKPQLLPILINIKYLKY